jgi:predicted GTPase
MVQANWLTHDHMPSDVLKETFETYPEIGVFAPCYGLWRSVQIKDLETTINNTPCDAVVIATPIDLSRIIKINKPTVKIGYELTGNRLSDIGRCSQATSL